MRRRLIIFGIVLIIGIGGVILFTDVLDNPAAASEVDGIPIGLAVGQRAPDFTGTTVNGDVVSLRDYRGRTVLVNVFASWCGPCIAETPHLVEAYNTSLDDAVVVGLNLLESTDAVMAYQDEFSISYPLVMDPDSEITSVYQPIGLPTSWFIDPEGIVRYVHIGPMTLAQIQEALIQAQ